MVESRLGPYEIISPLGAGGMGEVYRARDPRIGREVAIKVLPAAFSTDSERLIRFEQEARAVGALNHPNILSLYDIGTEKGSPYLVSELLEGQTLRKKIHEKSIPQRKVVDYSLQIARGLSAAHLKRIVHRDLKPENIFVTKDGRVKILDFGLAKLVHPEAPKSLLTQAPTVTRQTNPGVALGTVVYMSPEQLRGEQVDHRTDIFAFGSILYEMLSGNRPFQGDSQIEVMHAILKEDPADLLQSNTNIPLSLQRIIGRCLEKNPEHRFQSASDLAFALESLSGATQPSSEIPALPAKRRTGRMIHFALTFLCAAAAFFFASQYFRHPAQPVLRASIPSPENTVFLNTFGGNALSPDGTKLAFVAQSDESEIWIRSMDSETPRKLRDTREAYFLFWSPEGRFIGFFTENKLKKIDIATGAVQSICDAADGRGATWNQEGIIVLAPNSGGPLYRVSATGGPLTRLTQLRQNETGHKWPYFLPDGKHFLYVAQSAGKKAKSSVFVASLDSKLDKLLIEGASNAAYAAPGYLIFARGFIDATLLAQPFNDKHLELESEPVTIAQKIAYNYLGSIAPFSVSNNGVLVYQRDILIPSRLIWMDRKCNEIESIDTPSVYSDRRISHDSKKIAVNRYDPETEQTDTWVYDTAQRKFTRFTTDGALKARLVWSPDDTQIVYGSEQNGAKNLYQKAAGGGLKETLLLDSEHLAGPIDWSPDGNFILFNTQDPVSQMDIWILPLTGDRKPFPFVQAPSFDFDGFFSPDERWIAYTSNESGRPEIYVRPFPISAGQWQVSSSGGYYPRWRRDGKELFYISTNDELMSVEVKPGSTFQTGTPKVLGQIPDSVEIEPGYDVTPDGQRFLVSMLTTKAVSVPLTIVLNWQAHLRNKDR